MLLLLNVIYVLVAVAMIALILMQRGAGAQAGSGFGAGASGTVFGSRGAANFLSKSTKWLAIVFFSISLFMAWNASQSVRQTPGVAQDLGLMSQVPATPAPAPAAGAGAAVPVAPQAAPASAVPAAPQAAAPSGEPTPPAESQGARESPAQGAPASGN